MIPKNAGKVRGVKATGQLVVVEMLNPQESMGTVLELGHNAKSPPQAYVVELGPQVDKTIWGFKPGDRVLLQGSFVPIFNWKGLSGRDMGIVMPHDIKCVFIEEND